MPMRRININGELTITLVEGMARYTGGTAYRANPALVDRHVLAYRQRLMDELKLVDGWIFASGRCPRCGGKPTHAA